MHSVCEDDLPSVIILRQPKLKFSLVFFLKLLLRKH